MGVLIILLLEQAFVSALPPQADVIKNVREDNVTITSPSFPSNYPPNSSVELRVNRPSPANFTLNFTHFSLERSVDCKFDSVRIVNSKPKYSLMTLCGNLSEQNRSVRLELSYGFSVLFKSDSSEQSQGFSLDVTTWTIPHHQLCDYMHDRQARRLHSSIGEVRQTYPTDLNCSWVISGQSNTQIVLRFKKLDVEFSGPDCVYDHIGVWDIQEKRNSSVDKPLAKVCGRHYPWELFTNSTKIRVSFISDSSANAGQFVIRYNNAPQSYFSSLTKNTYVTPTVQTESSFADDIKQSLRLMWKFRTNPGFSIQVHLKTLSNQGICLYDGPDKSFRKVYVNKRQRVVSSEGFHLIVFIDVTADRQDNITFASRRNAHRPQDWAYTYFTRNWFRAAVESACSHVICPSPVYESFLEGFPNIDNCAYAGLAVYDGALQFDRLIGTFCNIYQGYLESLIGNVFSVRNTFHILYYRYKTARPTQFVSVYYFISAKLSSYPCRKYFLTQAQNQVYNSYSFTMNATFKDRQYNISIEYTEYEWDCVGVQVLPQFTGMKQINLLLKGQFSYRICRQAFNKKVSNAVSPNHEFTKPCSQYNLSSDSTETTLSVNGQPMEYLLIELGTAPFGHTDQVELHFQPTDYVLNLVSGNIYRYDVPSQSFRIVLPHNYLTTGNDRVHVKVSYIEPFPGHAALIKISEESRKLGTKVQWSALRNVTTLKRFNFHSLPGVDVVVSFVGVESVAMYIRAMQITPRPLFLDSTPTKERCVMFGGHCYTLKQSALPTSWQATRADCVASGGDLVSVNSGEELQFLNEALSSVWFSHFYGKRRGMIFIGLHDLTMAKDYRWVDGSPLAFADWYYPFVFGFLLPDSPTPPIDREYIQPVVNRSQRCVTMVPGNSFLSSTNWRKVDCCQLSFTSSVYGICEYNNSLSHFDGSQSRAVSKPDDPVKHRCGAGWHFVHNTCVLVLSYPLTRSREETESLCTSYGGRIPTVDAVRKSQSLLLSLGFSGVIGTIGTIWVKLESDEVICLEVSWNSQSRSFTYKNCVFTRRELAICERDPVEIKLYCLPYQFSCEDGTCLNPDRICDLNKDCSHGEDESNCTLSGYLFTCDSGEQISVFKLCDFRVDCLDESDENLCIHSPCSGFQFKCENKQCISMDLRCDQKPDCMDGSDEEDCDWGTGCHGFKCPLAGCVVNSQIDDMQPDCPDNSEADESTKVLIVPYPDSFRQDCPEKVDHIRCHKDHVKCYPADKVCVYDHDIYGRLKYCSNGAHLRHCREYECPDMFKCPKSYCIPHHKVCDGAQDCVKGEDESSCDIRTCPGMLKCGSTNQCVPLENICDMEINCKYDWSDEKFCDLKNYSCPLNCTCVGYYVGCRDNQLQTVVDTSVMKTVQVLDLGKNRISLLRGFDFEYLAVLYLQHNIIKNLSSLTFVTLGNLIHLDVSFNKIEVIPDGALSGLSRLQTLKMVGNPVHQISRDSFQNLNFLRTLNLSGMLLDKLGPRRFEHLNSLQSLDLSNNSIRQLSPETFTSIPPLDVLYLHDNLLNLSTPDALQNLDVRLLRVDSSRLCCAAGQTVRTCVAPVEALSCEDLLPTTIIRVIVGVFAVLAILGNVFVISWRLYKRLPDVPSVFIFHLSISDLLMGLYLLAISVADHHYRGVYILHDLKWQSSVYCKLIGIMGFISCEMSMYTLVLIAVDRTKKLAFPMSSGQITVSQAWIIQFVGWGVWTFLGVCPLILPAYFGDYYGRNAICLPLNFADPRGPGWEMITAIFVGFNSIGLVMIIAMYVLIFLKVKESQKKSGRRDRIEVDIARKLSIVIVTDLACMLPIVLANFTSVIGQPIDRGMASILGNLVLPLNSALNPFLFTLNNLKLPTVCTCNRKLLLTDTQLSSLRLQTSRNSE